MDPTIAAQVTALNKQGIQYNSLSSPKYPLAPVTNFAHINPAPSTISDTLPEIPEKTSSHYLGEKLLGDVLIATGVTALAAPFISIVDKALVQRSSGSHTIVQSAAQSCISIFRHPIQYLKSPTYLWMWATYAATYSAANSLRTLTEHQDEHAYSSSRAQEEGVSTPPISTTASTTLFVGTAITNSSASILKDRAYAKLFGSASTAGVPKISYGLWMVRDITVIGAAFILPSHVAKVLQDKMPEMKQRDTMAVAQLATPVAAQVIAGPLHFLGLDCYNRSLSHMSLSARIVERSRFLASGFVEVVAARMVRIIPGYGIAGVMNTELRGQWREQVQERQAAASCSSNNGAGNLVAWMGASKGVA